MTGVVNYDSLSEIENAKQMCLPGEISARLHKSLWKLEDKSMFTLKKSKLSDLILGEIFILRKYRHNQPPH